MAPRAKPAPDEISDAQLLRYARHVMLDEIGEEGQARLLAARVLVVGAGGLGSPLLLYLAAAGVGGLRVVDDDTVDLTNLQRQIVHTTSRISARKADSAREAVLALNPEVCVEAHAVRLTEENAVSLIAGCDVVADGTDNFAARFILSDACARARVPLVSAALQRFEGQITVFRPWLGGPCYRCLFPEPPPEDLIPRCEEAGIMGAVAGVLGTLQATEVIKEILALGESLDGTLLFYDALAASFRRITVRKNPTCPACGTTAR